MTTEQKLREALNDAATSLETLANLSGRAQYGNPPIPTFMEHFSDVRSYAASRARIAREALAQPPAPEQQAPQGRISVPFEALERWRAAFAEELSAWDIDPPLHHVKASHDEIAALLAASPATPEAAKPETEQAKMVEKIINGVREFYLGFLSHSLPHSELNRVRSASVTSGAIEAVIDRFSALLAADSKSDHTAILRMLAQRARSFPDFPMGYHMPEVFKAVGEEPPEPADSKAGGEPVAGWMRISMGSLGGFRKNPACLLPDGDYPLYTRPQQQAKPLTDERCEQLLRNGKWFPPIASAELWFLRGIRAAERAHGIEDQA